MYESIHEKKQNKWRKEDAPGSIDFQVIERKWEPSCLTCMCVCVCLHRVYVCGYAWDLYCMVALHMCIENVTVFLAAYLMATDLLFGIDSVWVFYRMYFSGEQELFAAKQAFKSINKEKERPAEEQRRHRIPRWYPQTPTTRMMLTTKGKIHFSYSKRFPKWNTCLINHFIINWMLAY